MKTTIKILIGLLGLLTLIPLRLGIQGWFGQASLCEFFGFSVITSDLKKLFIVAAGFILTLAIFQILAIVWLIKGKAEGLLMPAIVGYTSIFRGIVMLMLLETTIINNVMISVIPIAIGAFIIILANMANKKEKLT